MDFYEPRDDLDEPPLEQTELSPIQQLYEGAHIFITGGSGFMGKVLIEKLLRSCNVGCIYVLVRDKKGMKPAERLMNLFSDEIFEPLKLKKPGEVFKVKLMVGDCKLPGLGLSPEDRDMLTRVNFIFHAAATLNMNQHLREAYTINVLATRTLLEIATTLPKLKAFIYISTAYTHAYRDLVEETFYDVVVDEDDISLICSQLDDFEIGSLTSKLTNRWGNTYALTKAIAENLVSKYDGILPIGVVRPSIVVSAWQEPLEGWINNVYGALGVVAGTAMGVLKLWCADPDLIGDMIPVDTAINMTICATWEVAVSNSSLKIYNATISSMNPITWDILRSSTFAHSNSGLDSAKAVGMPSLFLLKYSSFFTFFTMLYHVIPALFIDFYLQLVGKTPQLMKIYIKIYNTNKLLMPYCVEGSIVFTSDNINKLLATLDPVDKRLFNFDISSLEWNYYWLMALKGMRVYLMKDPMETIPEGIKLTRRLWMRKLIFDSVVWMSFSSIAYYFSKNVLYSLF